MPYFHKHDLVDYLFKKHIEVKGYNISPVKLQKTLYLLYAMWAGNAVNLNSENEARDGVSEFGMDFDVDLFPPAFEAWKYGPVDREIYFKFKNNEYAIDDQQAHLDLYNCVGVESTIMTFIEDIIEQTFNLNDFALVDITHKDNSWKKPFEMDPSGKTEMKKEEIMCEYAKRLKN